MAIACIAKTEVPEVWPRLPHDLVRAISLRHNTALVAGAVRCLSMFVDELEEEQVVPVSSNRSNCYSTQLWLDQHWLK